VLSINMDWISIEGRELVLTTIQDVSERKRAEDRLARDNELLSGIARIFREVLSCDTEEGLGRACLEVAEKITDSRFGFLGEVNAETGALELIAISNPVWAERQLAQDAGGRAKLATALAIDSLCGQVLTGGASLFTNDPPSHPDGVRLPAGHTPLNAFLGVPLQLGGRTIGMVGLGDREGGFAEDQLRDVELLAPAIVQAFAGKRAERAQRDAMLTAQRHEAEIEAMYDAAPIGLCVVDREGRYLRINQHLAQINGHPPEAHIGRTFREIVPGVADQAEQMLRQVLETGKPIAGVEIRGEVPSQPGVERTWIENWVPVMDAGGTIVGVHAAAEEITSRKRMEEELRRANQVKDEFLATLSHELRTPLNAILGWSDMLRRGLLDQAVSRQAIEAIARNAEAQMHLISDVLDVSRMIAGKLRLELEEVDLLQVAHQATTSLRPAADAKGVSLALEAGCTGAAVTGDPHRLQQIVWNLLSNAIKFTAAGGSVTVRLLTAADHAVLSVADTGAGIPPELLSSVFERFVQADSSTTRRHGGLGLGLSIVRQLAELHGGTVSAASEGEGCGATFTVNLPLRSERVAQGASAPAARAVSDDLHGLRVLVLDDVEDARSLVSTIVQGAGGEAAAAASVDEALALVASTPPAVIVADIAMPSADGYEFLRRLRVDQRSNIPVIALTAYGSAADREKALAAGFAEHLGKPVLRDHLLAALRRAARPTNASFA
jgi:PAS domain S-box-containing protein